LEIISSRTHQRHAHLERQNMTVPIWQPASIPQELPLPHHRLWARSRGWMALMYWPFSYLLLKLVVAWPETRNVNNELMILNQ